MENEDHFSSLIIEQSSSQYFVSNEETMSSKKLKARRRLNETPIDNPSSCRFKFVIKYDGFFKLINRGSKMKYCFGRQKTIYCDRLSYGYFDLMEDVSSLYSLDEDVVLSLCFLDKRVAAQSYVQVVDGNTYKLMLEVYEDKEEVVIYTTKADIHFDQNGEKEREGGQDDTINYEEDSDYCHSEDSYHSRLSDEDEEELHQEVGYEGEFYSYDKDNPKMEVGAIYPGVVAFRRALNHYAVLHNFEYNLDKSDCKRVTASCSSLECSWRIHASITRDDVTFEVRTTQPVHTCHGINKRRNKHATKGWVADRIVGDVKVDGEVSVKELKLKLESKYSISLPYERVWEGKQQAILEIYGKWDDSFSHIGDFKGELMRRDPESVVEFEVETIQDKKHFQRFFVALGACRIGFFNGCRPYIALDSCHMNGKWKGVIAAATGVDGNNFIFPIAFAVMESENENSWEWFLRALYKAIKMPNGLVISSDMQKGLQNAIAKVYPLAERRECMRHLYSNFKKQFRGDLFNFGLWGAARTYSSRRFEAFISELKKQCPASIDYLNKHHTNVWSRSRFGTIAKCDYLTNNIAETFNSWISKERQKPVTDMFDSIRQKIMLKFSQRRRKANTWKGRLVPKVADYIKWISRNVDGYEVHKSMDFSAEVQKSGSRWVVNLEEKTCTCRGWQVKGIPCIHAASFIASIRNPKWEDYVDPYFTVTRFKAAYDVGIAPMPSKNEWLKVDLGYILLPPILKRPAGRPRKNRIRASDEPKKRSHRCTRCGSYGHHKNTCKNPVPQEASQTNTLNQPSLERSRISSKIGVKRRACPPNIFNLLEEERN